MKIFHRMIGSILIFTLFLATAFVCCCERLAFADSCHTSSASAHHCHHSVSQNYDHNVQLSTAASSCRCDCEKIVADQSVPLFEISISNDFEPLQKIFAVSGLIFPTTIYLSSATIHSPPILESASTPFYLKFFNFRI